MNSRPSRPYSTSRFFGSCRVTAIFWLVPRKSCEGARVEYVMVPVPEELAERVLRFVEYRRQYARAEERQAEAAANRAAASDDDPNEPVMARVYRTLDPGAAALLAVVSRAALRDGRISVTEAARMMNVSEREVLGTMLELNYFIVEHGGPQLAVLTQAGETRAPDASFFDDQFLITRAEIAEPVVAVAGLEDDVSFGG